MRSKLCFFLAIIFLTQNAFANEAIIARCENLKGKTYYTHLKNITAPESGWREDGIKSGVFEFTMNDQKELDARYMDVLNRIKTWRQEGVQISLLNKGQNEVSILVQYPEQAVEVYTLYTDLEGKNKLMLTIIRGGDKAIATKSTILNGECSAINFSAFAAENAQPQGNASE